MWLDRAPASGVGLVALFALREGADVGLVLVCLLHSPVVADDDGGGRRCLRPRQRRFGKQPDGRSDFLAVVLLQTVVLQRLSALVVETVVAKDGGQVAVLWPHGRGQRVEGKFRLLAGLLQGLAEEQGGLFDHQPALVARCWFQLSLFYRCNQICIKAKICITRPSTLTQNTLYTLVLIMKLIVKLEFYL